MVRSAVIRKIYFRVFLATILLAPLPFASNRPWSWSLLACLTGLLLVAGAFIDHQERTSLSQFLRRISPGLVLWLGVAAWIVFQSLSEIGADLAHPLFAEASALIGTPSLSSISVDPYATRTALMRFLTYGGVFWIAARLCQDADAAANVLKAFVVAVGIYAVYGLVIFFLDLKMILWFDKWAYEKDLTSTFVNRNSFATFAGLGVLASVALTFDVIGRRLEGHLNIREVLREFFEAVFSTAWLPFLCFLVTATALLLSHSRGGFLSTTLALVVLLLTLAYIRRLPGKFGLAIVAIVAAGSLFALSMSGDLVVRRLQDTSLEREARDEVYARVIEAVEANPNLGTGYGTFESAFMPYKTRYLAGATWDKAHNSYLELAMELGIPATLSVLLVFAWLAGSFLYGLVRRRRRRIYPALGLAALVLVAAHATVDFSLQIPGFTVCYAMLAGMAWAQSWPTRRREANWHKPALPAAPATPPSAGSSHPTG
jgi:O-antigen ligase